ncbi:hypothetical protein M569_09518, partial [Genlisea aurea]
RDKSPGLKILWVWTFGTAAVLVANVASTRMRQLKAAIEGENSSPDQSAVHVIRDD